MVFLGKTHDNFRYKFISAIKCTKINVRTHLLIVGKLTYEFVKKIGQGFFMLQSVHVLEIDGFLTLTVVILSNIRWLRWRSS